jgi:hypothetical protein
MTARETIVKKCVVNSSREERRRLDGFIRKGKRPAQRVTKARILLMLSKADISDAGEGSSDSRIAEARDARIATVKQTRQQLVEEGFEAILPRKHNPKCARPRIFDEVAEAKSIALACGPAPAGHAKWRLHPLEEKVVELHIADSASDNTIGRTLKKHSPAASRAAMGDRPQGQRGLRGQRGRHAGGLPEAARSRAPDGLILSPPFAPVPCWWTRTMVPSIRAYSKCNSQAV